MRIVNALNELQPEQFYLVYGIVFLVLAAAALWSTSSAVLSNGKKLGYLILGVVLVTLIFYIVRWLHTDVNYIVAWVVAVLPLLSAMRGGNVIGKTLLSNYKQSFK